jgi:hypothetical protein
LVLQQSSVYNVLISIWTVFLDKADNITVAVQKYS